MYAKPFHGKSDKTGKVNYRPISILPNLSETQEEIMYNQISLFFLSFQCRFRKAFNAQHCLLLMTKKSRKVLDNGGETVSAVLTNFPKHWTTITTIY